MSADERVPKCEKVGNEWVIIAEGGPPVRVKDRGLADHIWRVAMRSYQNGNADALAKVRAAIGVDP